MASAWSASLYWESGGRAPSGSRGRAPGQGVRGSGVQGPPEAESFLALGRATDRANLYLAVFSAVHYNKLERCKIRAGTLQ